MDFNGNVTCASSCGCLHTCLLEKPSLSLHNSHFAGILFDLRSRLQADCCSNKLKLRRQIHCGLNLSVLTYIKLINKELLASRKRQVLSKSPKFYAGLILIKTKLHHREAIVEWKVPVCGAWPACFTDCLNSHASYHKIISRTISALEELRNNQTTISMNRFFARHAVKMLTDRYFTCNDLSIFQWNCKLIRSSAG